MLSRKVLFLTFFSIISTICTNSQSEIWPASEWLTATPEEVDMNATMLKQARDYALTGGGSGCIIRGGKLVMAWGDQAQRYDLKSTAKSIGITALGLAIKDGKIELDDKVKQHHPEFGVPPDSNIDTGWLDDITIQHLCTQTAGFDKPGGHMPLLFAPGTKWAYSDGGPNWLAECITLAYQQDVNTLLFDRVFMPLGIKPADLVWRENAYRDHTINGIKRREFGSGISANVNAMARIGLLYLRGGEWDGKEIIPRSFVDAARTSKPEVVGLPVSNDPQKRYGEASDHYGLLWWNNTDGTLPEVPRDAYWSWGLHESFIFVIPSLDIVAARAGRDWQKKWSGRYDILEPFLGPIVASVSNAEPSGIEFSQSADTVDVYDFVEVVVNIENPDSTNPFTDVAVEGQFSCDGDEPVPVDGFCDSEDGSTFRIRFMPTQPGEYSYSVKYRQGSRETVHAGSFTAVDAKRQGIVSVDSEHPWHFVWEGTGEHYFWNGTTAYWIMGWDDETIFKSLDRLADLKVNRVRAVIMGRVKNGRSWYEDVYPSEKFTFLLNPWKAERPDSIEDPGFDVTRFNVAHWQKYERLLRHARERNIAISVIFYVDGRRPGVNPFGKEQAGGEDEQRYYRYGVSRLAAFSNVMWDVTNEYRLFRDDAWAEKMGAFIRQHDPYDHLTSVHGHGDFRFRTSPWADFAMYQRWDEHGGYEYMLKNREEQAETGRVIPQVNEEYGYEDHYPTGWGGSRKAPARSADNRRRLAWGMYMAGGYQTAGERANAENVGGWINGAGDDTMILFKGYGHIVDFFTAIPWWKLEPDSSIIEVPGKHSAETELTHVVYTRDKTGHAVMYLQGAEQASATVSGDISNWDSGYRLMLANELTNDRPWLGELHQVAIYDRPLSPEEVSQNFQSGVGATAAGPQVLYNLREGNGDVVKDVSGIGEPLNLKISDTNAVKWLPEGGLAVLKPVLIASTEAASKIVDSAIGEITIEAWIKPANTTQEGPARIVSLSQDTGGRNFTLGQAEEAYEVRFRTTTTSANGEPSLWSSGDRMGRLICASRSQNGDLAVIYFSAGGEVIVKSGALNEGLKAEWFNPRNGHRMSAEGEQGVYRTPDEEDWALLFQKASPDAK